MRYLLLCFLLAWQGLVAETGLIPGDVVRYWDGATQKDAIITHDTGTMYTLLTDSGVIWKSYNQVVKVSNIGLTANQFDEIITNLEIIDDHGETISDNSEILIQYADQQAGLTAHQLSEAMSINQYLQAYSITKQNIDGDSGQSNPTQGEDMATHWVKATSNAIFNEPTWETYQNADQALKDILFPDGPPWTVYKQLPVRDEFGQVIIYQASLLQDINNTLANQDFEVDVSVDVGDVNVNVPDIEFPTDANITGTISYVGPTELGYNGITELGYNGPTELTFDNTTPLHLENSNPFEVTLNQTTTNNNPITVTNPTGTPINVSLDPTVQLEVTNTSLESVLSTELLTQTSTLENSLTSNFTNLQTPLQQIETAQVASQQALENLDNNLGGWGVPMPNGNIAPANMGEAMAQIRDGIVNGDINNTQALNLSKHILEQFYNRNHDDLELVIQAVQGIDLDFEGNQTLQVNLDPLVRLIKGNGVDSNASDFVGLLNKFGDNNETSAENFIRTLKDRISGEIDADSLFALKDQLLEDLEQSTLEVENMLQTPLPLPNISTEGSGMFVVNWMDTDGAMNSHDFFAANSFGIGLPSLESIGAWVKVLIGVFALYLYFFRGKEMVAEAIKTLLLAHESNPQTNHGGAIGGIVNGPIKFGRIVMVSFFVLGFLSSVVLLFEGPIDGDPDNLVAHITQSLGMLVTGGAIVGMGFVARSWDWFCMFVPVLTIGSLVTSFYGLRYTLLISTFTYNRAIRTAS